MAAQTGPIALVQYALTHFFRGQHRGQFPLLKMYQNSKSQIVTKLKNTNGDKPKTSTRDKTKKMYCDQSQIAQNLENSNCDKI